MIDVRNAMAAALTEEPPLPATEVYLTRGRRARSRRRAAVGAGTSIVMVVGAITVLLGAPGLGTLAPDRVAGGPGSTVAPASLPSCDKGPLGLSFAVVGSSRVPQHDRAAVEAVVRKAGVGPESITGVQAVMVTDPVAPKLGLGKATSPRLMWAITGTSVTRPPTYRVDAREGVRLPVYPVGTVLRSLTLVDDLTLSLAGNFSCGVSHGPRLD